jgi:hypothetical protein
MTLNVLTPLFAVAICGSVAATGVTGLIPIGQTQGHRSRSWRHSPVPREGFSDHTAPSPEVSHWLFYERPCGRVGVPA